jgi:sulfite reductase (NADPH) hemoprotein beta-component
MSTSTILSTIKGLTGATLIPSPILSNSQLSAPCLLVLPPHQLIQLLPTLRTLVKSNVVLQVSTQATHCHSSVVALRDSGLVLLYSPDQSTALPNSQVASTIAATGRAVLHFGEFSNEELLMASSSEKSIERTNGSNATIGSAFSSSTATTSSYHGSATPSNLIIALGNTAALIPSLPSNSALISLNLYRPLSPAYIRALVPAGVEKIVVLEQVAQSITKWAPLFLDVVGAFAESEDDQVTPVILSGILGRLDLTEGLAANAAITRTFPRSFSVSIVIRH